MLYTEQKNFIDLFSIEEFLNLTMYLLRLREFHTEEQIKLEK